MQHFMNALKNYANFNGRARRKEFWIFVIAAGVISTIATLIAIAISGGLDPDVERTMFGLSPTAFGVMSAAILVFICPVLSVTVRRLHDTGHSALWISFLIAFYIAMTLTWAVQSFAASLAIATFALGFVTFILFVTNFILLFCADSQKGENQYGPNPKNE
ncbi:MAG: DUF805 domain-containing protein [Oscillospiraceae bacterium]|nr:DUF805 domain-containing protein [Oscillospiraceae bacterium]